MHRRWSFLDFKKLQTKNKLILLKITVFIFRTLTNWVKKLKVEKSDGRWVMLSLIAFQPSTNIPNLPSIKFCSSPLQSTFPQLLLNALSVFCKIMSCLRVTMGQERFSGLALMHVHNFQFWLLKRFNKFGNFMLLSVLFSEKLRMEKGWMVMKYLKLWLSRLKITTVWLKHWKLFFFMLSVL